MRSIQSGEKECADLSGRSGRGHLVLVCAERGRPRLLLRVKIQPGTWQHRWVWLARFFSDVLEQIRFNWERKAFRSDRSRFVRFWKRMQPLYMWI